MKSSTLNDEFIHHLSVFDQSTGFVKMRHTVNDDYHLLKLKIKNGENHSLHDPLRGKLAVGEKI